MCTGTGISPVVSDRSMVFGGGLSVVTGGQW